MGNTSPERFEPANLSPALQVHAAELLELRSRLFTFDVVEENAQSAQTTGQAAPAAAPSAPSAEAVPQRTEAVGAAAFAATTLGLKE